LFNRPSAAANAFKFDFFVSNESVYFDTSHILVGLHIQILCVSKTEKLQNICTA
jgi:hypothetical protein